MPSQCGLVILGVAALLSGLPAALGQSAPPLRSAASFVVLGGTSVSNTGPTTITGNVGVTPGSTVTGISSGNFTVGEILRGDAAARARIDADAVEAELTGRACTATLLSFPGRTLPPGVYCFPSRDVALTGTLLLDAAGDRDAVWIFRIAGALATAAESSVLVLNGGYDGNVFWQVGTSATLESGSAFTGNLLAQTSITLRHGATLSGRLFARTGSVTLNTNKVSLCCEPITLSPAALPGGTVGTAYSQTITASGGTAPYTFKVSSGALPTGLTLAATGLLSGSPSEAGRFAFTVTATDSHGCSGTASYVVTVVCPIVFPPAEPPGGTACIPYTYTILATGSTPLTFTARPAALPPGLSLSAGGVLSGTPTTPGTYSVPVTATDGLSRSCSRTFSIPIVCPVTSISPPTLRSGVVGDDYSETLIGMGCPGRDTFEIREAALPPGLKLAGGVIFGVPMSPGTYPLTIKVTAANGCSTTRDDAIRIDCGNVELRPWALANGRVGTTYSATFIPSRGTAPFTFVTLSGGVPGVPLSPGGTLSGVPSTAGSFPLTFRVTDAVGCFLDVSICSVDVDAATCPSDASITLAPASLAAGEPGVPYVQAMTASGAMAPYTYSVTASTLPPGLILNAMTGVIAGTPTANGIFDFTMMATDANGCISSRCYTIRVGNNVPALSGWGMVMMAIALAAGGWMVVRRTDV